MRKEMIRSLVSCGVTQASSAAARWLRSNPRWV